MNGMKKNLVDAWPADDGIMVKIPGVTKKPIRLTQIQASKLADRLQRALVASYANGRPRRDKIPEVPKACF